jgi:predicted small secreted protein
MIKNNCVNLEKALMMKFVILMLVSVTIAGCGTIAGTLRGAGEDIKTGTDTVADWVKPKK